MVCSSLLGRALIIVGEACGDSTTAQMKKRECFFERATVNLELAVATDEGDSNLERKSRETYRKLLRATELRLTISRVLRRIAGSD